MLIRVDTNSQQLINFFIIFYFHIQKLALFIILITTLACWHIIITTNTNLCFYLPTDAPICETDKVVLVGAAKDENVEVICNINADPPAKWVDGFGALGAFVCWVTWELFEALKLSKAFKIIEKDV